jgi:hypothetical protein
MHPELGTAFVPVRIDDAASSPPPIASASPRSEHLGKLPLPELNSNLKGGTVYAVAYTNLE